MPDVVIEGLTKRFGRIEAVHDLTFEVPPGKVTGFLGPNGAGKTTTLRMLLGLVTPTTGRALIGGTPYARLPHPRRVVGAAVEAMAAHPGRRGRDHLRTIAAAAGVGLDRVDEVLDEVGLAEAGHRRVGGYSLGMRQRLGLAAALLRAPRLLVLDEPTNGLDPQGIREMRDLLLGLNHEGTTIFLSSHLLAEVEQMCTRVGVLDRGRLVVQDRLASLRAPTGRTVVVTPDGDRALGLLDGRVELREGERLVVRGSDPAELNRLLVDGGVRVRELAPERRGLEQVVLEATTDPHHVGASR